MNPIIPIRRKDPFNDPRFLFEPKLDGFRGAEHILDTKAGHFDRAEFEDRYESAVVEMPEAEASRDAPEEGRSYCQMLVTEGIRRQRFETSV